MKDIKNQNISKVAKVTKYKIQSKFENMFGDEDNINLIEDVSPIPLPQKQKIQTKGFSISNSNKNLQNKNIPNKTNNNNNNNNKNSNHMNNEELNSKFSKLEKKQETPDKSEEHFELPIEYNPYPNLNQIPVKQYIPQVQISQETKLISKDQISPKIVYENKIIPQFENNQYKKVNIFPPPIPKSKKIPSKNQTYKNDSNSKFKDKDFNLVAKRDFERSETKKEDNAHYFSEIDELEVEKANFQNHGDNKKLGEFASTNMINHSQAEKQNDNFKNTKNNEFKPYSVNDYKILKQDNPLRLGGLGPNIGGKDWEEKMLKKNKVEHFAEEVRLLNKELQPITKPRNSSLDARRSDAKQKVDKAKEYAKKIPKPKLKKVSSKNLNELKNQKNLENLEQKHNKYYSEIEKIKQLIND